MELWENIKEFFNDFYVDNIESADWHIAWLDGKEACSYGIINCYNYLIETPAQYILALVFLFFFTMFVLFRLFHLAFRDAELW